jgi:hypothetical protein
LSRPATAWTVTEKTVHTKLSRPETKRTASATGR